MAEFVIMPNHFHGIVCIETPKGGRTEATRTLGSIVRGFKAAVTRRIRMQSDRPEAEVWQRNFYEHVIRNQEDYERIAAYILDNPINREKDDYHKTTETQVGPTTEWPSCHPAIETLVGACGARPKPAK